MDPKFTIIVALLTVLMSIPLIMIIQFVLENFANREPIGLYYFSSQSSVPANANANATKLRSASTSTSDDGIVPEKWNGIGVRRNGSGYRNDKNDAIHAIPIAIPNCNTYYYGQPEGRSDFATLVLTGAGPDCGTDTGGGGGAGTGVGTGTDYVGRGVRGLERGGSGSGRGGSGLGTRSGSGRELGRGGAERAGAVAVAVGNAPLASHSTETAHLAYAGNNTAIHYTVLYYDTLYCDVTHSYALYCTIPCCIMALCAVLYVFNYAVL